MHTNKFIKPLPYVTLTNKIYACKLHKIFVWAHKKYGRTKLKYFAKFKLI